MCIFTANYAIFTVKLQNFMGDAAHKELYKAFPSSIFRALADDLSNFWKKKYSHCIFRVLISDYRKNNWIFKMIFSLLIKILIIPIFVLKLKKSVVFFIRFGPVTSIVFSYLKTYRSIQKMAFLFFKLITDTLLRSYHWPRVVCY